MAGFADVLGHEQTIAHMKKAIGAMYALSVMPSGAVHESAGYYQGDP